MLNPVTLRPVEAAGEPAAGGAVEAPDSGSLGAAPVEQRWVPAAGTPDAGTDDVIMPEVVTSEVEDHDQQSHEHVCNSEADEGAGAACSSETSPSVGDGVRCTPGGGRSGEHSDPQFSDVDSHPEWEWVEREGVGEPDAAPPPVHVDPAERPDSDPADHLPSLGAYAVAVHLHAVCATTGGSPC